MFTSILVYIFAAIIGILLLYIIIRVSGVAWYRSKLDFIISQRKGKGKEN